ncbi:RepB family plasmid replication initiator protein [Acinetobacter baumannii]
MRDLVVKDNALINASYNLDLVEQRLIYWLLLKQGKVGKGLMQMIH